MVYAAITVTIPRDALMKLHTVPSKYRIIDIAGEIYPEPPEVNFPHVCLDKEAKCLVPYCSQPADRTIRESTRTSKRTGEKETTKKRTRISLFCVEHSHVYRPNDSLNIPNLEPFMRYIMPLALDPKKYVMIFELQESSIPDLEKRFNQKAIVVSEPKVEDNEIFSKRCWAESQIKNTRDEFVCYAPVEEVLFWEFLKLNNNPTDLVRSKEQIDEYMKDITHVQTSLEIEESSSSDDSGYD